MKQWNMVRLLLMLSEVLSTLVTQLDIDFVKVSLYIYLFIFVIWMVENTSLCASVFHKFEYCNDILGPVCVVVCIAAYFKL